MSYYDHATMIVHQLGPWQPRQSPALDRPTENKPPRGAPNRVLRWIGRCLRPLIARRRPAAVRPERCGTLVAGAPVLLDPAPDGNR